MTNNVTLVGRLTKDIDIKTASTGTQIANFTLAVNRTFGKSEQSADFINCVAFKKTAEILSQYTNKGSQIAVVGRIQTRNYENKEGKKVFVTEVIANEVQLLDSKGSNQSQGTNPQGGQTSGTQPAQQAPESNPFANSSAPDIQESELPF